MKLYMHPVSMTSRPVVWSKLRKFNWLPGGALKTLGNVIGAGVAKLVMPGAWTVMSR